MDSNNILNIQENTTILNAHTKKSWKLTGCTSYLFIPLFYSILFYSCNILTFDRAVNQETGAFGRRYWNITLTCGRVEFGADATLTGSRWMSNNYITRCNRWFELVGVRGRQSSVRVAITVRVQFEFQSQLGSICGSLFRLQLTSHT